MDVLSLCQTGRPFAVCAGAIATRAADGLVVLLTAVVLSGCGEQAPAKSTAAQPTSEPRQEPDSERPPPQGASKPPPTEAGPRPSEPVSPPRVSEPAPVQTAPRPAGLPAFPWPPPRYSAFSTIARQWVAPGAQTTLAFAARRIEEAFDAAGYGERSYYWIPGGFALVSRIEQIRSDATPFEPPERWAVETPTVREGFIDHIRALFNAPPGFYRVIVFTVTDQDFAASERAPTSNEARNWMLTGSMRLPEAVGTRLYSDRHYTTALIYEFERRADVPEARVKTPSDSPGQVHLEKAGLWRALARP